MNVWEEDLWQEDKKTGRDGWMEVGREEGREEW